MNAYLISLRGGYGFSERIGITYAEDSDAAQTIADEAAHRISPNASAIVTYLSESSAESMIDDGVTVY